MENFRTYRRNHRMDEAAERATRGQMVEHYAAYALIPIIREMSMHEATLRKFAVPLFPASDRANTDYPREASIVKYPPTYDELKFISGTAQVALEALMEELKRNPKLIKDCVKRARNKRPKWWDRELQLRNR